MSSRLNAASLALLLLPFGAAWMPSPHPSFLKARSYRPNTRRSASVANQGDIFRPANYYEEELCSDEDEDDEVCELPGDAEFTVAILGGEPRLRLMSPIVRWPPP